MKVNKNLPNIICYIRIILIPFVLLFLLDSPVSMMLSMSTRMLTAGIIFVVAMLSDMLDGKIARKYNLVSDLGKFLDPIADKLLVIGVLVAFIQCGIVASVPVILILAREFIVTGLRLAAVAKGEVIAANIFGKIKTTVQGILMTFVFGYMFYICLTVENTVSFAASSQNFGSLPDICIWIIAAVTVVSVIPYFKNSGKYLKG